MLHNIAKRIARREGGVSQSAVLHRLRGRITVEVMRRAACMLLQCRPAQVEIDKEDVAPASHTTLESERRAGGPGTAALPPYVAPPSGADMLG